MSVLAVVSAPLWIPLGDRLGGIEIGRLRCQVDALPLGLPVDVDGDVALVIGEGDVSHRCIGWAAAD